VTDGDSRIDRRDWVGRTLKGRYLVERVLGGGGMGTVYLARDRDMDREVVVKVPHSRFLDDELFRARFAKEVRSLTRLSQAHIVRVLDAGDEPEAGRAEPTPFAVLEYLDGGSLADRLGDGTQPPSEVLTWLPDVAKALDFIHGQGVVHRDVKPGNILFDRADNAVLADFGIAKALGSLDTGLTRTGTTPGSPPYMGPEIGLGLPLGPAYDQYALAVLVYKALSGALPHDGTSGEVMIARKAFVEPTDLASTAPSVPAAVRDAVMRALARKPEERYPSCVEFSRAFGEAVARKTAAPVAAPIPPPLPPPPVPLRPSPESMELIVSSDLVPVEPALELSEDSEPYFPLAERSSTRLAPEPPYEPGEALLIKLPMVWSGSRWLWIAIVTIAVLAIGLLAFALTRSRVARGTSKASRLGVWVDKLYAAEAIEKATRDEWMGVLKVDDGSDEANARIAAVEEGARSTIMGDIARAADALRAWEATYERVGPVSGEDPTRGAWEGSWKKLERSMPSNGQDQEVDTDLLGTEMANKFRALAAQRNHPRIRVEATEPSTPLNAVMVVVAGVIDEVVGRSALRINGMAAELKNGRFDQIIKLPESDGTFDVWLQASGGAGLAERRLGYTVDRTAPRILIDDSAEGVRVTNEPSIVITGQIEEANGLRSFIGPGGQPIEPNARGEFRFLAEFRQEEERDFQFKSTDLAGNTSSASTRIRFRRP